MVNDTLRRGMSPSPGPVERPLFKVRPFSSGLNPGVDPENPKAYLDELDAQEFLRKNPDL